MASRETRRPATAAAVAGAVAGAGTPYRRAGAYCRQAGAMAEAEAEAVTLSATVHVGGTRDCARVL